MEQYKQLKVRLLVSLAFAVFFGVMLVYFIIDKNHWMSISMTLLVIASCGKSIRLYKTIKE